MKWPLAILAALAIVFMLPSFFVFNGLMSDDAFRMADWLSIRFFDAFFHTSVHQFGEFPFWCPYVGGGYPTFQHPSDGSFSPFILPVLFFGPVIGVKINLLILLFLGGLGVFLLGRDICGFGKWPALFSACAFMTAGWLPSMLLVGFYNLAMYMLVPLIVYFVLRAFRQIRFAIPAGVLFAVFSLQGVSGIYALGMFIGFLTLLHSFSWRDRRPRFRFKPAIALGIVLVVLLGVGAVKTLSVRELVGRGFYSHDMENAPDRYSYLDAVDFFYRSPMHFLESAVTHVSIEAEYDNQSAEPTSDEYSFLGLPWIAVLLFPFGAWFARKRLWALLLTGLIFLLLCFGPYFPIDFYSLLIWPLRPLRRISQFYKYFNFYIYFVLVLSVGGALHWLREKRQNDKTAVILTVFTFLLLGQSVIYNAPLFGELFKKPVPQLEQAESFYQVRTTHDPLNGHGFTLYREIVRPEQLTEYYNLSRNVGTIDWYADIYLPENAVPRFFVSPEGQAIDNADYRGEAWFTDDKNHVVSLSFTANSQRATVNAAHDGLLIFNQNYDPAWTSDSGAVENHEGHLAVRVSAGTQEVIACYRPAIFFRGLAISLLSLVSCAVAWVLLTRRERQLASTH